MNELRTAQRGGPPFVYVQSAPLQPGLSNLQATEPESTKVVRRVGASALRPCAGPRKRQSPGPDELRTWRCV